MNSEIKYDKDGPFVIQDPLGDELWHADFNDQVNGPALDAGELIASVSAVALTRQDGGAITTEQVHHQTNTTTLVNFYVKGLILGLVYVASIVVNSNASTPRVIPRSFRVVCRKR